MGSHLPLSLSDSPVLPMLAVQPGLLAESAPDVLARTQRILERVRDLSAKPESDPRSLRHVHRYAARQWQTGRLAPQVLRAELDRLEGKLSALEAMARGQ